MGQTICEKILARTAGKTLVKPGEYLWARVDGVSIIGGGIYSRLKKLGIKQFFNPEVIFATEDHLAPAPNIESADITKDLRRLVKEYGLTNYFEVGSGVQHELFPDQGFVSPGDLLVGPDSHIISLGCFNVAACAVNEELPFLLQTGKVWLRVPKTIKFILKGKLLTGEKCVVGKDIFLFLAAKFGPDYANYQSLEFSGEGLDSLTLASRFTISNMSAEIGAKFAIFSYDNKTASYFKKRLKRPARPVIADKDAIYQAINEIDISDIPPYVSLPHSPCRGVPVELIALKKIRIHQAFIGSCSNGRTEDFLLAAKILKDRKIEPNVRLIATPASQKIWQECLNNGVWEIFSRAGAVITNSTCGACAGIQLGVLGDNEICISTSNRNYPGRMGSTSSSVYLANPATVAASAVKGYIADPREFC
jgi:3-isopropylmalate/(R)-2-methylmalate dehydratase large subunit